MKNSYFISVMAAFLLCSSQALAVSDKKGDQKSSKDIFVDVGRAKKKSLNLAIPRFSISKGANRYLNAKAASGYANYLKNMYKFLGIANLVSERKFVAPKNAAALPFKPQQWAAVGAQFVIFGRFTRANKSHVSLELSLYDIRRKRRVLGKEYPRVKHGAVRNILRRFADLTIEKISGIPGPFSSRIAFVARKKMGGDKQVYVSTFDGREVKQITNVKGAIHLSPSWSPDGTKLSYSAFRGRDWEVYIYNFLTKKEYRLTRRKGKDSGASFHPTQKDTLVYAAGNIRATGRSEIYTINSRTGTGRRKIISGPLEVEPRFSPDGTKLAWSSSRYNNRPHILIRDLYSNTDTRLTFAGWYNTTPSWRPDGRKLAFAGYDKETDFYDVFIVNPDGTQMERLTLKQGDNEHPTFSADGRFIVFQSNRNPKNPRRKKKTRDFYVMNRDGANPRRLPLPFFDVEQPTWGPRIDETSSAFH